MTKRTRDNKDNNFVPFIEKDIDNYAWSPIPGTDGYFDLYVKSSNFEYDTSNTPGLSDKRLYSIDNKTTLFSIGKATQLLQNRIKSATHKGEHLVSREILRGTLKTTKIGNPVGEKGEFYYAYYLVTHDGFAKYMEKAYRNNRPGDVLHDIHRIVCFHETQYFNQKPYKLIVDIEYEPHKIPKDIQTESKPENLSYKNVLLEVKEKIRLLLQCLKQYWLSFKGSDKSKCKFQYIVFQSNRAPKTPDSLIWKVSYHVIWYVDECRFVDQPTAGIFLRNATSYDPKTGKLDESLRNRFFVNGHCLFDYAVYGARNFRTPYSCKVHCSKEGVLCPPLLPDVSFNEEGTFAGPPDELALIQNEPEGKFHKGTFLAGLFHYIGPNENVQFFISLSESKRESKEAKQMNVMAFEQQLWSRFPDTEALNEASQKLFTMYGRPGLYDATEPISIRDQIIQIGDKLGEEFISICKKKAKSGYGHIDISVKPAEIRTYTLETGYTYEIVVYWCLSNNKDRYPCLMRPLMRYQPHDSNNSYFVLNIHERKWYVGCHDLDCGAQYKKRKKVNTFDVLNSESKKNAKTDDFILEPQTELDNLVGFLSYSYLYYDSMVRKRETKSELDNPNRIVTVLDPKNIGPDQFNKVEILKFDLESSVNEMVDEMFKD